MSIRKTIFAVFTIFLFAIVWNGIIHLVILKDAEKIMFEIGRKEEDRNILLSLFITAGIALIFVLSYLRCRKSGIITEGITHGLFFGILAVLLVDLNQFILYPIPAYLVLLWSVFGIIEFCFYGIIASRIFRTA